VENKNMPILPIFNTGRDNMIKIGLCSVTFRKLSVEQVIDLCLQAGLEGIEWGGDIHVPSGNDARAAEVAALTEQANLDIVSYGSYYRLGPDEKEDVPFEDVLKTAVRLKAPAVRVWAGGKGSEETSEKERAEIVRDGQRIAALAEQKGVTVNIEYHGNTLTDTPASADRLMKEIDHPNMRLYWQPAVGESVDRRTDSIRQVLPWLTHVHVFHWADTDRLSLEAGKEAIQKTHEQAMQRQRDSLATDHEKKLLAQKAASDKETFRMQRKVEDLQRQLERKSNDELGDGAEVDLYNDLKRAFPDDVIRRVKRGVAGADIKHEIHVEGRLCGKIIYDSKNRGDWKTAYAEQLRKDQMAEKADYAILGTRKFPQNTREMTIRNGVILVNPGRATVIAGLLRNALVQLSSVKLSETGKHEKRRALYDYVTSTRCATLFTRVEDQVANLRGLDEQERTQQERMRKNRAKHVGEIEKAVIGELQREIHKILGL
jgi:3-dehydroshikimate dehydratase